LLLATACGEDSAGPSGNADDAHWWDGFASSTVGEASEVVELDGVPVAIVDTWTVAQWNGAAWTPILALAYPLYPQHLTVLRGNLVLTDWSAHVDSLGIRVRTWDGTMWQVSPRFKGANIAYCAVEFEGTLVLGGSFGRPTFPTSGIAARWDGATLTLLGDASAQGLYTCRALVVLNGKLIADGTHVLEGDAWVPLPGGLVPPNYADRMVADGSVLYARVRVLDQGPITTTSLRRLEGTVWTTVWDEPTSEMAAYNGTLVVGTDRWNGTTWSTLGSGVTWNAVSPAPGGVFDLFAVGNRLYVAGAFSHAGLKPSRGVARWEE
jgi:hypothetical protein